MAVATEEFGLPPPLGPLHLLSAARISFQCRVYRAAVRLTGPLYFCFATAHKFKIFLTSALFV